MDAKSISRRALCVLAAMAVALAASLLWAAPKAYANGVQYVSRSFSYPNIVTETKTCTSYARLADMNSDEELYDGWWYVADESETYGTSDRWEVLGTANIIIKNGVTITCEDGIHVPAGKTLNIYFEPGESGKLDARADTNAVAAIGGDDGESGGTVNIHGGTVVADAYNDNDGEEGAGIGGGNMGSGGTVNIYGGTVQASGANYGAGIGSGDADGDNIHGGETAIYGGNVTAKGGCDAAGIGGGEGGGAGTIRIYRDSTVNATGGSSSDDGGAGIGSGDKDGRTTDPGTIIINSGNVTAKGGANAAGIGGGEGSNIGRIEIYGGTVNATGGSTNADGGAGIGTGDGKGNELDVKGVILIKGGDITAQGGADAAGIGLGNDANMHWFYVEIHGGTVNATGGVLGAGIGGGQNSNTSTYSDYSDTITVTIYGGSVTARGGRDAAALGAGDDGYYGKVTLGDAAAISLYPGSGSQAVKAEKIEFAGEVSVASRTSEGAALTLASRDDRESVLRSTGKQYVEAKHCEHEAWIYTEASDSDQDHNRSCAYCNKSDREACTFDTFSKFYWYGDGYDSQPDYQKYKAFAVIRCKCYNVKNEKATVTSSEANGKRIYTASYEFNGTTYTETREFKLPAINPTVSIEGWTYGETAKSPVLGEGSNPGGGRVTYQYKARGADDSTYSGTVPTDAGDYTVRASVAGTIEYLSGSATADFTIAKAQNVVAVSLENWAVGQEAKVPVVTASAGADAATFEYKAKGAGEEAYSPAVPNVEGEYTVRATVPETANHLSGSATTDFKVLKQWADFTYSLSLQGDIGVNFYLKNLEDTLGRYEVSVGEGEDTQVVQPEPTADGRYRYELASRAAKEMGDEVHVVVKHGDEVIKEGDYSVKGYCDAVIGDKTGEYDEGLVDLCKATLDYGSYAQKEFGYNANKPVNGGADVSDWASIDAPTYGAAKADNSNGAVTGVTLSLVTTSKTQLVARFKCGAESIAGYSATVGGEAAGVSLDNGKVKVVVEGIAAKDLDAKKAIVLTCPNEGTYTFEVSPVDYMGLAVSKSSQVELNRAFYNYHLKAKAFADANGQSAVLNRAPSSGLTAAAPAL